MRDIRYAVRALVRTPTVTLTALLVMALGIGATTAMFSVANAVLFRPLPYADPERLVQLGTVPILEFQAYREGSRSFEGLSSYAAVNKNLHDAAAPERISVVATERGLFDVLGVRALAGRTFAPSDPTNVAVVSEGFWRRRYGATASVNDWTIVLDGQTHTVVGIMPEWFQFPYRTTMTDVWIPADQRRSCHRHSRGARADALSPRLALRSDADGSATFTAATLALVGVALMACLNPARRAMAVDTITACGANRMMHSLA